MTENMLSTKLNSIDLDSKIEFLGLINKNGRLVNFVKKDDFKLSEKTSDILFMSIRLQNSMQNDFAEQFGKLLEIIIEHKKYRFFLFPIGTMIGVAIVKNNINGTQLKNLVISNLNVLMNNTKIKEMLK